MKILTGTKYSLLAAMYEARHDTMTHFGIREPRECRYYPPENIWERIKQVFTGPKTRTEAGIIEVTIIRSIGARDISIEERDDIANAAKETVALGIQVRFVECEG